MEFILGNEILDKDKIIVSTIFANGFYQWFKYFSKDINKIAVAFEHSFVMDKFTFAICENKICGMSACTDGVIPSIKLIKKDLIKGFGLIKGNIANMVLKGELENHPYPFDLEQDTMSIEFVAVDSNFQNQGVASNLIKHIIENNKANKFILEVADTNVPAVNLYTKLGFVEFLSVPQKHSKQSGINNMLYMKYTK